MRGRGDEELLRKKFALLTDREVGLLAEALVNLATAKTIARHNSVQPATIRQARRSIHLKLGVRTREELAVLVGAAEAVDPSIVWRGMATPTATEAALRRLRKGA